MNRNDRAVVGCTMIGHSMFHFYELAIPLFVVIWLDVFDVSAAVLGSIVGAGFALIGLGAPVSGVLADSYGSRTLVSVSMLGMGGGFVLVSLAPTVWLVAVALVVWGAAASLYHPAGLSLLTRGASERGTALAYHGAAGNVGTAIGPFVAAILLTFLEWRLVAALFVLPPLAGILLVSRLEFDETAAVDMGEEALADGDGVTDLRTLAGQSRVLFAGGFAVAFAIMVLHGVYSRGVLTFLPEILASLPVFDPVVLAGESFEPSQYVYAALLLVGGVGQYAGGKLSDWGGVETTLIGVYVAIVAVSLLFFPAVDAGLAPLLVVCGVLGFTVYMTAPIRQALVAKYATAEVHGLSFGYTYLAVFGVGALGASFAGIVLTYASREVFFVAFAAFAAAIVLLGAALVVRSS